MFFVIFKSKDANNRFKNMLITNKVGKAFNLFIWQNVVRKKMHISWCV